MKKKISLMLSAIIIVIFISCLNVNAKEIITSINPKTNDNILPYMVMLIISSIGLIGVTIYAKRKKLALAKVRYYK